MAMRLLFPTKIELGVPSLRDQLLVVAPIYGAIASLGVIRSRQLCPSQVPKPSILLSLPPPLRLPS